MNTTLKHTNFDNVKMGDFFIRDGIAPIEHLTTIRWKVVGVTEESLDLYNPNGTEYYDEDDGFEVLDDYNVRLNKETIQFHMQDLGFYFLSN